MLRFIARRLLGAIPTLLLIIIMAFFLMRVAKGGPFDQERKLPPEIEKNILAAYDLDKPLLQQFVDVNGFVCTAFFTGTHDEAAATAQGLSWDGTKYVNTQGRQVRCFCDVRDVAASLPRLLGDASCHGRVFNVGGDRPVTIEDLAGAVLRVTGSTSAINRVPHSQVFGDACEDLAIRVPDSARIRAAIGFEPAIGLDRTIADIASECARHPETIA
jgi:hypothetical protein